MCHLMPAWIDSQLSVSLCAQSSGRTLLISDLWMCGMTPPPAIVACDDRQGRSESVITFYTESELQLMPESQV
jgi:hypothetical protein